MFKKNRILFYSSVNDINLFNVTGFYKYDIEALESRGFIVTKTNKFRSFLKFWEYDISFLYFYKKSTLPGFLSYLFNKKIIYTGGIDELSNDFKVSIIKRLIYKLLFLLNYFFSDSCNIVSIKDIENINNLFYLFGLKNANKLKYFPHSINTDNPLFNLACKKDNIFTTICWMGSVDNVKRKGVDTSLKFFKLFLSFNPDFKFYIIGTPGAGKLYLQELIDEYKINDSVFFTGEIDENLKIELLKKSMFYFQISQYEGFGLAVLEAMLCKNYIIHSGKGGLIDTIGENGLIINNFNNISKDVELLNILYKNYYDEIDNLENNRIYVINKFHITERAQYFDKIIK